MPKLEPISKYNLYGHINFGDHDRIRHLFMVAADTSRNNIVEHNEVEQLSAWYNKDKNEIFDHEEQAKFIADIADKLPATGSVGHADYQSYEYRVGFTADAIKQARDKGSIHIRDYTAGRKLDGNVVTVLALLDLNRYGYYSMLDPKDRHQATGGQKPSMKFERWE